MAKILVVEDKTPLRDVFCGALRDEGFQVQEAVNGDQALLALEQSTFDLIVTDILMPDCDGIEVIRHIKAHFPKLKIVALCGGGLHVTLELLEMVKALGACEALAKPVLPTLLLEKTRSLLISGRPTRDPSFGQT